MLLANYVVTSTSDTPVAPTPDVPNPLTLRQAITEADANPGPNTISFNLVPKNIPGVVNFDLTNQVWTIDVNNNVPLPPITSQVTIDGYTQSFVTSFQNPNVFQKVTLIDSPTGGTFTLSFEGDTTGPIPYNATAAQVQAALVALPDIGPGNAEAALGPVNTVGVVIDLYGAAPAPIQLLTGDATNLQGLSLVAPPAVAISPVFADITSVPNAETVGFDAQVRVIVDGANAMNEQSDFPGLTIESDHNIIRGLSIDGFSAGIALQGQDAIGDLIQGNYLGRYLVFPNSSISAAPSFVAGIGNGVGVDIGPQNPALPSNNSVGGVSPATHNAIAGNLEQGVVIDLGANYNQVVGNLIGVLEQDSTDYYQVGNGAEGVLIQSQSNLIGGDTAGATNVISANLTYGVHIEGPGALDNRVDGNYIGTDINGEYLFGQGDPGNGEDGIFIDDAPSNQIGIPAPAQGGIIGISNVGGNVISGNSGAGVRVSGAAATGNIIQGNLIGTDRSGASALGNSLEGVVLASADNTVGGTIAGAGNLISGNWSGVLVSGPAAGGTLIAGNMIGTDETGTYVLGNALDGVEIDGASDNTIGGTVTAARNVISGNNIGVLITAATATSNLVEGNYIGTDVTGLLVLGNENEGVRIEGAPANTIGGTSPAATNVISGNGWGVTITDPTAIDNIVEANFIGVGTDGLTPLGNEVDGVLITDDASNNTIGGTGGGQANTIAFNLATGVFVDSGTGDSILTNSIYSNGRQGIVLVGTANNAQSAPTLTGATGGGTGSNIQGSLTSIPSTTFLIQFFSSPVPDPSGFGQGETFLGSTTVMTSAAGSAPINVNLVNGLATGAWATALATNESTGDTSAFSNAISAQPAGVAFSAASYTVASNAGMETIDVLRTGNLNVAVSVSYATSNGSAIAGQDYTSVAGTLTFAPSVTDLSFTIPILDNPNRSTSFSTVNLTLSQPGGGATLGAISSATLNITNSNQNVSTFVVTNTGDSGPGTLRAAILAANADPNPGVDNIVFDIPASTAPLLNVPVAGFDPTTQTWTIALQSPLPEITHAVAIDGYTQANAGVPFVYPGNITSAVQLVSVDATGGFFTLTTSAPLPVNASTQPIPFDATAAQVQAALAMIVGANNVVVTGGPVAAGVTITFQGMYGQEAIPNLIITSNLTGPTPTFNVQTVTVGGVIQSTNEITSAPNTLAALIGNNAQVRVIVNGSQAPSGATDIGFEINASNSLLRGLAIEGFNVGVSVPNPTDAGDLIQGNFIGEYLAYPVDPNSGIALPSPSTVELAGLGNTQQGVVLGSRNATLGGVETQDSNVIGGNGSQGVLIEPGASGNQVLGNQIGLAGPSSSGSYFLAGNGAEGVLIESSGTAANPASIIYASSNIIGGAVAGAGNLISDNHTTGVHIEGVGATRNLVEGNYIGLAPGGDFVFGGSRTGNLADGVWIDDAPGNQVGGPVSSDGNVISSNAGNGVNITGADASGNTVQNNIIGLTAAGTSALGNDEAGVADTAPGTIIGPGNVISANLIGVSISGAGATGVVVTGNLIGTDPTGEADLGNAQQGVEIDNASGDTVSGNGQGSQVISGNLVGVEIDGANSTGNLIEGNFIGIDKAGTADRGNANQGVLINGASGNTIGGTTPAARNVISANQWGIELEGPAAAGNLVEGNFVGTDVTGTLPLGNEVVGILIEGAAGNTVGGTTAAASNVISANNTGIQLDGPTTTGNVVAGNLIGTNVTGTLPLGNRVDGILIEGAAGNTVGGTTAAARNVISANQWGIQLDGPTAMGNSVEGNFIGTDLTGTLPLGNTVNGILFSNNASNNTVGGTAAGQGNTIAFNVAAGVSVLSGTGDSILSNSIFSNGQRGIFLSATGNNGQSAPVISTVIGGGGAVTLIEGSLTSVPNTSFLIQFFSNITPDPSGFGQGQTFIGSTTVTTDASGNATINFQLPSGVPAGEWVTATATNQSTGDTSEFSNAVQAQTTSVEFSMANYTVDSTAGSVEIDVLRTGSLSFPVSVNYATSNGTAIAGLDYTAVMGTLTFPANVSEESFSVPILVNPQRSTPTSFFNVTLSQPTGGAALGPISTATVTIVNQSQPSSSMFVVVNTNDSGPGSLRQAIINANADLSPGTADIEFAIPASTAPGLNVPVPGFDPSTQDWTITLDSPLPAITRSEVSIDGYSQAHIGVPFLYPNSTSSAVQTLSILGSPTGGTFTLTTASPLPVGTTAAIPYTADAATVQNALAAIIGAGNVAVTGGPLPSGSLTITFQGAYAQQAIPNLTVTNNLTGGNSPGVDVTTSTPGGVAGTPTLITSVPNSTAATDGNNARVRVIVDGSKLPLGSIGFQVEASSVALRGLIIDGFGVGVEISSPVYTGPADFSGNLIQGNLIGRYLLYPVDPNTGAPIPAPNSEEVAGQGNGQGVVIDAYGTNTTLGGASPQDDNVIAGNAAQGVEIASGADGNQVLGNQIGVIGPSSAGYYYDVPNGAQGILVESSSNLIGVAGAGNIVSANAGDGVEIEGTGATENLVQANLIGTGPGGGYLFGNGDPGNRGDGVDIQDAPGNLIGGGSTALANTISSNAEAGVFITGALASGNVVSNNIIGLTSDGSQVLGNEAQGVAVYSPGAQVGPGNVISANLIGVLISGPAAAGVTVIGNLIGTDITGKLDLGNEDQGVLIDSATGVVVEGNATGSQVISGNNVGVEIEGLSATGNLVQGNLIGTDISGTLPLPNSQQGILIEGAPGNTVGGTTAAARNVISANQWGIEVDGPTATGNLIEGNYIGTDVTGTVPLGNEVDGILIEGAASNVVGGTTAAASNVISANPWGIQLDGLTATGNLIEGNLTGTAANGTSPLGNEVDGVLFSSNASNNTVGGTAAGQGNMIAFNAQYGVNVDSGTGDSILTNSIFSNGLLGIYLNPLTNANDSIMPPKLTAAVPNANLQTTTVQGS
ncbi:MAG: beta strand repeat-containing protein, partial [Isosphaeraceae bacterium]